MRYAVVATLPVAWLLARSWGGTDTFAACAGIALIVLTAAVASRLGRLEVRGRVFALAWIIAAAVSTAFALLQYLGMQDFAGPLVSHASAGEAYANLRQRNQYASLTVIGMAAVLWQVRSGGGGWIAVGLMAFLAVGDAATTSRTGLVLLLMLLAAAVIWPGSYKRDVLRYCIAALLAYALASVILPWLLFEWRGVHAPDLWSRVSDSSACSSRWILWSNVLRLVALRPWLGWGWGELDYAHYMTIYPGDRFCDILDNAHNLPLHIAVELGVPAALLACLCVLAAVWRGRPWREGDPTRQLAWCVVMVIAAHSFFEYPLWYGPFQMAFGVAVGLLWPARSATGSEARPLAFAIPAMLLMLVAYATWDYRRVSQVYLPPEARMPAYRNSPMLLVQDSAIFRNQVRFAQLTLSTLTRDNAAWTLETSLALLHYSPEPKVIQRVIEAATLLGRDDVALEHLARFRAAFPAEYAAWAAQFAHAAR
jgi:O-antigen ligase